VEHFAQIALVTHLLGQQRPLQGEALKKLLVARSKYGGTHSAAPLPLADCNGSANGGRSPASHKLASAVSEKGAKFTKQALSSR